MSITVLNPGLMTTVQDMGRVGYQQFGVSVSGVMDPRSAAIANILVGNPEDEAVLECTMMGPQLLFNQAETIAITLNYRKSQRHHIRSLSVICLHMTLILMCNSIIFTGSI